jgi:hypothetical protein
MQEKPQQAPPQHLGGNRYQLCLRTRTDVITGFLRRRVHLHQSRRVYLPTPQKGNAGQRADRVLRFPFGHDAISALFRRASRLPLGRPLFNLPTSELSNYLTMSHPPRRRLPAPARSLYLPLLPERQHLSGPIHWCPACAHYGAKRSFLHQDHAPPLHQWLYWTLLRSPETVRASPYALALIPVAKRKLYYEICQYDSTIVT